ncbi:MAG TPA: hypothetical protein P5531_05075 [Bacteroidales bacterium]|nr:hypothetical protein [Bacteroidales bacterium]HSA42624.1 hypothetical protein [Bacteroidales bacterium]
MTEALGIGSRVKHPEFGAGVVIQLRNDAYEIVFIDHGFKQIMRTYQHLEIVEAMEEERDLVSYEKVERSFLRLIRQLTDIQETVPLAKKWAGGRIILEPGDTKLAGKDLPIDAFFHKIVMIRDRLRVLEQRVNASELPDIDKVNIQQYITRIYGTLTSFNVLFAEKEHYFQGEKT